MGAPTARSGRWSPILAALRSPFGTVGATRSAWHRSCVGTAKRVSAEGERPTCSSPIPRLLAGCAPELTVARSKTSRSARSNPQTADRSQSARGRLHPDPEVSGDVIGHVDAAALDLNRPRHRGRDFARWRLQSGHPRRREHGRPGVPAPTALDPVFCALYRSSLKPPSWRLVPRSLTAPQHHNH